MVTGSGAQSVLPVLAWLLGAEAIGGLARHGSCGADSAGVGTVVGWATEASSDLAFFSPPSAFLPPQVGFMAELAESACYWTDLPVSMGADSPASFSRCFSWPTPFGVVGGRGYC